MQVFVRGASELIPLELEKDDTVQDIRVNFKIEKRKFSPIDRIREA